MLTLGKFGNDVVSTPRYVSSGNWIFAKRIAIFRPGSSKDILVRKATWFPFLHVFSAHFEKKCLLATSAFHIKSIKGEMFISHTYTLFTLMFPQKFFFDTVSHYVLAKKLPLVYSPAYLIDFSFFELQLGADLDICRIVWYKAPKPCVKRFKRDER